MHASDNDGATDSLANQRKDRLGRAFIYIYEYKRSIKKRQVCVCAADDGRNVIKSSRSSSLSKNCCSAVCRVGTQIYICIFLQPPSRRIGFAEPVLYRDVFNSDPNISSLRLFGSTYIGVKDQIPGGESMTPTTSRLLFDTFRPFCSTHLSIYRS